MLTNPDMKQLCVAAIASSSLLLFNFAGCTGGQETKADTVTTKAPTSTSGAAQAAQKSADLDARKQIKAINQAIPLYPDSEFRADLTQRDQVMIRNQYGSDAQVYTLSTEAAFPQVWHYYVTYLAQFRGYHPPEPYPSQGQQWRTLQVPLNEAMQDPFVPGDAMQSPKQVMLQVAETEGEPATVIRYIVSSHPIAAPAEPSR